MACYSNETKHTCSKVVLVVGALSFIMGLLVAIFGFAQMGVAEEYTSEYANFDLEGGFAIGTIIGGIFCIVTGVLGCLTGKFKKPFFTLPFIILACLIAIFLLVAGAVMAGGEDAIKDLVAEGCNTVYEGETIQQLLQGQYNDLVDMQMCSTECPCPTSVQTLWDSLPAERLANSSRVMSTETAGVGEVAFNFDDTGDVYNTYADCYNGSLKEQIKTANDSGSADATTQEMLNKAQLFFEEGGFTMMKQFEEEYDCGGICFQPLFYLTKDVSQGAVSKTCDDAVIEEFSGNYAGAAVAIISALVLIVGAIGGFPLCTGFDAEE